uniref:Beta-2-glycoprotein 1 n=1 Tax=Leptobrachium leishanense TaxID=445787 RepID=A0A8C5QDV9_9ANUR
MKNLHRLQNFMLVLVWEKCDLPNVENGKIAQYYYVFTKFYFPMEEGKKLSISCAAGYTSESGKPEETIVCTSKGWEPEPICFKKCIKLSLDNGVVFNAKEQYKILEKMQYGCSDGYVTSKGDKNEEIICSSSGWSPQPECHRISDRCELPPLVNGHYVSKKNVFKVKEIVEYQCDIGYRTTSGITEDFVECLLKGWSSIPQCTKLLCEKLAPVENGWFYPSKASYADRDVVQFFCREDYILKGSELIQCYSFGWYPLPPTCEDRRNRCPPIPKLPHAIALSDSIRHYNGDNVRYECEKDYLLIGSKNIQCENGQWTSPPNCVEIKVNIKCDDPPATENGAAMKNMETYQSGDVARYACTKGYRIEGSNEIMCTLGKWPEPPTCVGNREYCTKPPSIVNGDLIDLPSTTYSEGSSVEYMCHSYHSMEGSERITCTSGVWSKLPTCIEPCTVSLTLMNERNVELLWSFEQGSSFMHGALVEFKCKEGFDAAPHSHLKGLCKQGQIQYPSCRRRDNLKSCGAPPVVSNSKINLVQEYYQSGSVVVYSCLEYHFIKGLSNIQCSNGVWESPPSCIEPCVLSKEKMERNHINVRWNLDNNGYLLHGEFAEFLCKGGYKNTQVTTSFSIRSQCIHGQLTYPECVSM